MRGARKRGGARRRPRPLGLVSSAEPPSSAGSGGTLVSDLTIRVTRAFALRTFALAATYIRKSRPACRSRQKSTLFPTRQSCRQKVALVSDETIVPANVDLVSDETTVPVVPLYSDPQRDIVHVASEISAPSRASLPEQEEPNVYKEELLSLVPQKAGSGGSKVVYYIDQHGGDWVLALPNERGAFDTYWPMMVRAELHLSEQLQELGIPCLEMYGVMSKNLAEAGGVAVPALRMRSFDYYRRTYNSVIMEAKQNSSSFAPSTMDHAIIASVYRSAGPVGEVAWVARVAGALIALLTPLASDIKLLAEKCIDLGTDSLNWQVVFQDDTLDVPLEIRIFLFDLTSKWRETESILAERQTAAEKARKASAYLDSYFGDIYPFVRDAKYRTPEYREIKKLVRDGMSAVALSSAP